MKESIKALLSLILIGCLIAASFFWIDDRPTSVVWGLRIGLPVLALAVLGFLIWYQDGRKDVETDYLKKLVGGYVSRNGLGFSVGDGLGEDRIFRFTVMYQNQQDQPCDVTIAMRPTKGFFMTRAKLERPRLSFSCKPGEVGIVRLAYAVPPEWKGYKFKLEIGATVLWPDGKGKSLRYWEGLTVPVDAEFRDFLSQRFVYFKSKFPLDAVSELPDGNPLTQEILWNLGDPPLA